MLLGGGGREGVWSASRRLRVFQVYSRNNRGISDELLIYIEM
jgi:hypothetical protein